jgi:sensor histidine kinase YesM
VNKYNLYWLCQVIGWNAFGALQVFLFSVSGKIDGAIILSQFFQVILYILLTHLLRFIILKFGWLRLKWYFLISRFALGTVVIAFTHFALILLISWLIGDFSSNRDLNLFSIIASLLVSVIIVFFWSIIYLSFHYFERYNKSLQYEANLKEVELNSLKSQLNPHFIFNALNSIRALVDENPIKSKQAITQLSNILRNSLITERKRLIPFDEEITTVKDYLALESIRYEERLKTSFELDSDSSYYNIPPLMIQTLVENGIKHGISHLKSGGRIELKSMVTEEGLKIEIRNSGKYMNGASKSTGYGLSNTQKRLELIYGDLATFKIGNEQKNLVLTEILIPKNI